MQIIKEEVSAFLAEDMQEDRPHKIFKNKDGVTMISYDARLNGADNPNVYSVRAPDELERLYNFLEPGDFEWLTDVQAGQEPKHIEPRDRWHARGSRPRRRRY